MNALRMKPNLYIVIAVITLIVLLTYSLMGKYNQQTTTAAPTDFEESQPIVTRTLTITKPALGIDAEGMPYTSVTETYNLDAPQIEREYAKFQVERGYPYNNNYGEYQDYDLATLEKLANSGDVRAMLQLAATLERTKYVDVEKLQPLYVEAATRGSTYAMKRMAMDLKTLVFLDQGSLSTETKKSHVMEAMAWCHVAEMRGDLAPKMLTLPGIERTITHHNLDISESDRKAASQLALEIYTTLETNRIDRGMEPFDNSVPPEVKQRYKAMGWE